MKRADSKQSSPSKSKLQAQAKAAPNSPSTIPKDVVEVVRKKITAPREAPPAGMASPFKPKTISSPSGANASQDDDSNGDDDIEDEKYDYDEDFEVAHVEEDDVPAVYFDEVYNQYNSPRNKPKSVKAEAIQALDVNSAETVEAFPVTSDSSRIEPYDFHPLLKLTYRDLRRFVLTHCPSQNVVRCYVERKRTGTNAMAPIFSLCADMNDGTGRELMLCKKVWMSNSAHYIFSMKQDDLYRNREQRSRLYLGKLRAISSTEYVLYDSGTEKSSMKFDPKESTNMEGEYIPPVHLDNAQSLYCKELAIIAINSKKRPCPPETRAMEVCLISHNQKIKSQPYSYVEAFREARKLGTQNTGKMTSNCLIIHERNSRFDPVSSVMNEYKGRANIPSVKNGHFVVSSPASGNRNDDQSKPFIVQIGKVSTIQPIYIYIVSL